MKAYLFLADFAQGKPGDKANAIGLGWTKTRASHPVNHSLLLMLDFGPNEPLVDVKATISLFDSEGKPVVDPNGVDVSAVVELGGATKDRTEHPTVIPVAVGIGGGLSLEPGLYHWRASIDYGDEHLDLDRPFAAVTADDTARGEVSLTVKDA